MIEQQAQNLNLKTSGYIPLAKWSKHYDYPTQASMRYFIFKDLKDLNKRAIKRLGRRVYVNVTEFFKWFKEL